MVDKLLLPRFIDIRPFIIRGVGEGKMVGWLKILDVFDGIVKIL